MKKNMRIPVFLIALIFLHLSFPAYTFADIKVGWLVAVSIEESSITIDEALGYPEKKYVTYKIADETKWHICTVKACEIDKGSKGISTFKDAADREAYGRPYKSFRVILDADGDAVKALEVQIATKLH